LTKQHHDEDIMMKSLTKHDLNDICSAGLLKVGDAQINLCFSMRYEVVYNASNRSAAVSHISRMLIYFVYKLFILFSRVYISISIHML